MYEVKSTASDWEDTFISLSQGPGETEKQKCENAPVRLRQGYVGH